MSSLLQTLIEQYLKDIVPPKSETLRQTELRAARIKDEYPRIYREILNSFDSVDEQISEIQLNIGTGYHMDGGAPDSVYLPFQKHDGGSID